MKQINFGTKFHGILEKIKYTDEEGTIKRLNRRISEEAMLDLSAEFRHEVMTKSDVIYLIIDGLVQSPIQRFVNNFIRAIQSNVRIKYFTTQFDDDSWNIVIKRGLKYCPQQELEDAYKRLYE